MSQLRLGLIGLDTSHVEALASAFNDPQSPHALPGARIEVAFPGGSADFPLSIDRVPRFTQSLESRYGIRMVSSPRQVAEQVDAVLLTSVDGRVHLSQFEAVVDLKRPTFLDKPFATTSADARAIAALASAHGTPLFSSSNLRFANSLQAALADDRGGAIYGADFAGPMTLQPTQPGFFWYGIHTVEMVYAALGRGCRDVTVHSAPDHDLAVGRWEDGRIGVARGNRCGNGAFVGVLHRERGQQWIDTSIGTPAHQRLAAAILEFFRGGPPPVSLPETVEIMRFLEAANESRSREGVTVRL